MQAAHLEQIGEIAVEMQDDLQRERPVAVITHGEALIGAAVPEEHRARDMHDVLLQYDLRAGAIVVVGIGEIDGEQRVVVARVRAEQQRLRPIQAQFEMGEKARIGVIEPIRSTRGRADIAEIVGDDECITVLERAARTRSRRGSENGKFQFHRSVRFMGFDLQRRLGEHVEPWTSGMAVARHPARMANPNNAQQRVMSSRDLAPHLAIM